MISFPTETILLEHLTTHPKLQHRFLRVHPEVTQRVANIFAEQPWNDHLLQDRLLLVCFGFNLGEKTFLWNVENSRAYKSITYPEIINLLTIALSEWPVSNPSNRPMRSIMCLHLFE